MTTSNDTLFLPKVTPITSAWLQPVNDVVFKGKNINFGTTTGTLNAQVLTLAQPSLYQAYAAGDSFIFIAGFTNVTGSVTLSVVGATTLPAVQIQCNGGIIGVGSIVAGNIYTVTYDGTYFQIAVAPVAAACIGNSATATIASGVTTYQYDVSATRAIGPNYQNLTGKTMFVSIITINLSGSTYVMNGQVGLTTGTYVVQAATTVIAGSTEGVNTLIVPNGSYYNLTVFGTGTATIAKWVELY